MGRKFKLLLDIIGLILFLGGAVIAGLASEDSLNRLTYAGGFLAGLGLALIFVDAIFTGRVVFSERYYTRSFSGCAARLWGLLMVLVGLAISGVAALEFLLPGGTLDIFGRGLGLGLVMLLIGISLLFYSIIEVLGAVEERESTLALVSSLPKRLFFLAAAVVGLALILAGLLQLIAPGAPLEVIKGFLPDLPAFPTPPAIGS